MFNGIIENQAKLISCKNSKLVLELLEPITKPIANIKLGDSICCNGVCLTVTEIFGNSINFDLAPETILKTNLTRSTNESIINLEFPMKIGDEISGHLVYGHVYGLGKLVSISEGNIITIETTQEIFQYLDYKAPVTIDGIALTISDIFVDKIQFTINIIPYTWEHTNLQYAKIGDQLNIEPDILAVYTIGIAKRYGKNSS
jgi:riboflavin synthase